MRKLKVAIVALVFAAVPTLGAARPAAAMTCAPDLEDACRIVFTVVCGVVAKGRPCVA
jgi:hypothetical protein